MKPTSTMKKEREAQTEAAQRPQEEAAALALRTLLAAFRPEIETRRELTNELHTALTAIEDACRDYQSAAGEAWKSNHAPWHNALEWGPTVPPASVTGLTGLVATFRDDHHDTLESSLGSGRTKSRLAITDPEFRNDLARDCDAILRAIDNAIAAGYARLETARKAEAALRSTVTFWLTHPDVRAAILAVIEYQNGHPNLTMPPKALADVGKLCSLFANGEEIAGRERPAQLFTHAWRGWLPIARELLAEEAKPVAA